MLVNKSARIVYLVILLAFICVAALGTQEAGKFWVNISQTGSLSYTINISISAGEALQIRTVRAPSIVDASELATKSTVRALAESQVAIPVSFIGEGTGRLWIAVNSTEDEAKQQYLVFDVFNAVRGTEINEEVKDAVNRWRDLSTSSVMQLGRTPVKCDKDLPQSIKDAGLFSETKALNGVIFIGTANSLDGSIKGFGNSDWGLQFISTRVGRVASFIEVGTLDPLPRQSTSQTTSTTPENTQTSGNNKTEPKPERNSTQNNNRSNRTESKPIENKPKKAEPKTGPFSGAGPAAYIQGLSVRKDWVASAGGTGGTGAGHFGETLVTLPAEYNTLSRVDSVELVLEIKTVGTAPGMGRISISERPMLANARPSGVWFDERYQQQGELLGEFDLRYDGPEFRYDVTNLVQSNPGGRYFVMVLNLSRTALEVTNIRLEVKGKY